jgi:formate dehydrogenase subunit beta
MLDTLKEIVISTLKEKKADGILGLRKGEWGIIQPHIFEEPGQMGALVTEPKWLLAKMAMTILRSSPEGYRMAVISRGCDERALMELVKRNQIEKDRLFTIGIACSSEQASVCLCQRPFPERLDAGEPVAGVDPFQDETIRELLVGEGPARMEKWAKLLKRCIKCYGCRNSCPICVCVPCKLEDEVWVETGVIPAEMITYHLIRAFHLSDTCVACKSCQEACPVNIPLLALQLSMREVLQKTYGYEAGLDTEKRSPILYALYKEPGEGRMLPDWINTLEKSDEH